MYTLEFETHETNENCKEIFSEYDWWKELVQKAAEKATRFEIHCWKDEEEGIAFGEKFGTELESTDHERAFAGDLTAEALAEMTENCVSEEGCLKYFTLNLYDGEKLLFTSEHYGYEVHWMAKGFAEMGFLMALVKNHPIITGFSGNR